MRSATERCCSVRSSLCFEEFVRFFLWYFVFVKKKCLAVNRSKIWTYLNWLQDVHKVHKVLRGLKQSVPFIHFKYFFIHFYVRMLQVHLLWRRFLTFGELLTRSHVLVVGKLYPLTLVTFTMVCLKLDLLRSNFFLACFFSVLQILNLAYSMFNILLTLK